MIVYIMGSFFLENIVGLLFNNHFIVPRFFLVSLLIWYQHKKMDYDKYLLYLVLIGFLYDIVYTNIYINSILYLTIGSFNILFMKYINNSNILKNLFYVFVLIIYELLYYFIYILLGLNNFNMIVLIKTFLTVIPINLLYYWLSCCYLKKFGR